MKHQLERAINSILRRGEMERYQLDAGGEQILGAAIRAVLLRPGAVSEISRLLAIATTLERDLDSPQTAAAVLAVLGREPRAVEIIRTKIIRSGALDETRRFLRSEGRDEAALRAPLHDDLEQRKERDQWPSTRPIRLELNELVVFKKEERQEDSTSRVRRRSKMEQTGVLATSRAPQCEPPAGN